MMQIRFNKPQIEEADIEAVSRVIRTGWLSRGPETVAFEQELLGYLNLDPSSFFCIALNSCTAGLHIALTYCKKELDIKYAIVPPITFPATINACIHAGIRPIFVDIDPSTGLMNLHQVKNLIELLGPSKAVIVPVHLYGQALDLRELKDYLIVSDSAHALETKLDNWSLPELSKFSAYSFYATKNITTCGEGGALIVQTQDEKLKEFLEVYSLHGVTKGAWKRYLKHEYKPWEAVENGFKYNITDVSSAMGRSQLTRIDKNLRRRHLIASVYDSVLKDKTPKLNSFTSIHARHLYPIFVNDRDKFISEMAAKGISVGVHFPNLALHRAFLNVPCPFGNRYAMEFGAKVVSLPFYPDLTEDEIDYILSAVTSSKFF
jgi:perosamine synthetase